MEVSAAYRELRDSLLKFIRRKVRNKEDAEDILQNVFVKAAAHVSGLSEKEKMRQWMFTITRNSIIDYYRAKRTYPLLKEIEDTLTSDDTEAMSCIDHCIHTVVQLLPEAYRDIIVDSELNGMRQKELAAKYRMAYSSMRSRVQRGRERLKQLLYRCCHIETNRRGEIVNVSARGTCPAYCEG